MINLLPQQYKEELKTEDNLKIVIILGTVFLIFLISIALVLFAIKIYIEGQVALVRFLALKEAEKSQVEQAILFREKIKAVSQTISKLDSFYKNKRDAAMILENVIQVLPKGVYLTSLSFRNDMAIISLSGFSPTRESLLELKNNLEAKKQFSEIYLPPQNWLKSTNIDFTVTFKVSR
jgi:Tfp pilus assembly protein PilN